MLLDSLDFGRKKKKSHTPLFNFTSSESFLHLRQQSKLFVRREGQSCAGVVRSRRPAEHNRQNTQRSEPDRDPTKAATQEQTMPRTGLNNLPPHSVNVRFYRCGEIKVDDIGHILEIYTSGDSKLFVLAP